MVKIYINQSAGRFEDNLGANERYFKTRSLRSAIESKVNEIIPASYEYKVTLPAGFIFKDMINYFVNIIEKEQINILVTNHEYPDFLELLGNKKNIKLIKYNINKSIEENLKKIKKIDIFLFSDVTYDFGIDTYSKALLNELKSKGNPIIIGDYAQSVGIKQICLDGVDICFFSNHKWLDLNWGLGGIIYNRKFMGDHNHKEFELLDGFMLKELQLLYDELDKFINRLTMPIGKLKVKNFCEENAKKFKELYFIKVDELSEKIIRETETIFSFIPVKNKDKGYEIYQDYISKGGAVKFISGLCLNGRYMDGFRITSLG